MHDLLNVRRYISANAAVSSTGDKVTWTVPGPITVKRWGFINVDSGIVDVGAGLVVSLERRVTAGSDTGRVVIDTISSGVTDVPVGGGLYSELTNGFSEAGSSAGTEPYDYRTDSAPAADTAIANRKLNAGDQLVFEVTDAADTAGVAVQFFVEYEENPWAPASRFSKLVKKNS